jgi:hypothetical protein
MHTFLPDRKYKAMERASSTLFFSFILIYFLFHFYFISLHWMISAISPILFRARQARNCSCPAWTCAFAFDPDRLMAGWHADVQYA